LLALNVSLQLGKYIPRGTCTSVWEPLFYCIKSLLDYTADS